MTTDPTCRTRTTTGPEIRKLPMSLFQSSLLSLALAFASALAAIVGYIALCG